MPIKIACIKLKGCHEIAQGTYQLVGANTTKKRLKGILPVQEHEGLRGKGEHA
jgi:hypothetical protein